MEKNPTSSPKDNAGSVGVGLQGARLPYGSAQHRDFFVLLKPRG